LGILLGIIETGGRLRKVEVREPECRPSSNKFEILMSRVVQTESPEET